MLYLAQFLDLGAAWASPVRKLAASHRHRTRTPSPTSTPRASPRYALVLLVITGLIAIIAVLRGPRRLVSTVAGAALIAAGVPGAAALAPAAERITVSSSELSFTTLTSEDPALALDAAAIRRLCGRIY